MSVLDRLRAHLDPVKPATNGHAPAAFAAPRGGRFAEIGSTGLNRQGGVIYEEPLRELRGSRWTAAVRDMTHNDATVGAILFAVEMLIRQVPWTVEPVSDAAEDQEAAKFVQECLDSMSVTWEDTLAEILTMLPWGWSLHELVYKRREDGRIIWDGWPIRSQDSLLEWQFDDAGRVLAMVQQAPPDYMTRTIPLSKALHFRTTNHKGNPEGFSMLRRAWRAWNAKRRIENLEGIGVERDLAGLPTVKIPDQAMQNAALYQAYKDLGANIRNDDQACIVIPSDRDEKGNALYEVSLLSPGGQRQFDTSGIITRYKTDIVMSVLMDFLMVGHEETGSWALSSSKTKIAATALGGWCKAIAAVPNRKAIPDLLALNGMTGQCILVHGDIETPDLGLLGTFIDQLAKAGAPLFPDDALENRLREYAGLPPVPEDREAMLALQQERDDMAAELETMRKQAPRQPMAEDQGVS